MIKLFYSALATLLLSVSLADAQRSIGRGQSPLTGRGGGSPLGPGNSGSGGSLSVTGSYQFLGPFTTVNGTNVYLNTTISNLAMTGAITNNFASRVTFDAAVSNSSGAFWSSDVSGFVSYSSPGNFMTMSHPQGGIFNTLDGWILGEGLSARTIMSLSTNTSIIESNLWIKGTNFANQIKLAGGQTASSLLRLDANTNVATVTIGSGITFDGTTISASGGGGGSASNYSTLNITNVIQRTVWHAGFTTNLTIPWGVTNRVVWQPSNTMAAVALSGTPGEGTNEQIIHLTAITTNPLMTTITMPTNGIDGLPPFFLTGPSTNEFDIIFNGYFIYIVSYQSPSTGTGQTAVMQTNATLYTPITRYVPTVISGTGGALTNFTLLSTYPEMSINGFTNVSITAVMGYDAGVVDYWTCVITNGSGSDRTLQFVATTNNWRFNGVYGTNAPNTLTNNTRLELSGRQHGTNVQVVYAYTPWP